MEQIVNLLQIVAVGLVVALLFDASFRATFWRVLRGFVSDAQRRRNAALYRSVPEGELEEEDEKGEELEASDQATQQVSDETIDALARLVAAGKVSAATACSIALGIDQRGNNAVYQRLKRRVAALTDGSDRDPIVAFDDRGRAVRRDAAQRLYTVDPSTRKKEYLQ